MQNTLTEIKTTKSLRHSHEKFKARVRTLGARRDGSAGVSTLRQLYHTNDCHYCNGYTLPHKRTIDHLTPLSRGGAHTKSNLVMACEACNRRKGALKSHEFFTLKFSHTLKKKKRQVELILEAKRRIIKHLSQ